MAFPAVGSSTTAQRQLWVGIPRAKCPSGDGTSRVDAQEETLRRLRLGLKAAVVVQLIEATDTDLACAIDRNWKPRRHYRRLGEGNTSRPILETYGQPKIKRKKERTVAATMKAKLPLRVKEFRVEADRPKVVAVQASSRPWTPPLMTSSLPSAALVVALIYAVAYFMTRPRWWRWGQRTGGDWELNRGRWVQDRSLGGKEVFIATAAMDWNPLGSDERHVHLSKDDTGDDGELPPWWKAASYIYIDPSRKNEARTSVQGIVRQLDDLRLRGEDYSFDLIIELYRICKVDACIAAKISRANVSRSLLMFATKRTAMLVAEGIGLMYSLEPIPFLCGLSEMLSVDTRTTESIIYRETAVKLRSLLLQVFADVRRDGHQDHSSGYPEKAIIHLLSTFPFPPSEAELVGASITSTTSEQVDQICNVRERDCNPRNAFGSTTESVLQGHPSKSSLGSSWVN